METVVQPVEVEQTIEKALTARIKALEDILANDFETRKRSIEWIKGHAEQIEEIGVIPTLCGHSIDFDHPNREQVLAIIKAFPGKWNKSASGTGEGMNYVREVQGDGISVRIWSGALPPSCRLVSERVVVPEHVTTKTRIVCNDGATLRDNQ